MPLVVDLTAKLKELYKVRCLGHKALEVLERYNSFLKSDLKDAADRFKIYLTLAHRGQNLESQNSAITQLMRP